ncbi:MAG: DUF1572 family protein [Phycisphaeraceae bacterium]|nr:DUF1572 family protein [Phycisphaerales bacterium]MCB9859663.1 DUF1572 family protein [Phycisphaeraceae bacterium]
MGKAPNLRYTQPLPANSIAMFVQLFERQKASAEHAIEQITDEHLFARPTDGMNSIAIIIQHISGNLRSRWTDFLTSDGEKPDRNRDTEFAEPPHDRELLMQKWDDAWAITLASIGSLSPDDLSRIVTIRSVPHTVHAALCRSMEHIGYHVGQIHLLARLLHGSAGWNWLTIPPGGSQTFNDQLMK